jgi:hypothetical protein
MKVGMLPPQFGPRQLLEGAPGSEPDRGAAGGFEQLLEAMRLAMDEQAFQPDGQAAALAPAIGSHSQAFERARLLVETALDLRGWNLPEGRPDVDRRIAERHEKIVAKVHELLERLAAQLAPHAPDAEPVAARLTNMAEPRIAAGLAKTNPMRAALPLPSSAVLHVQGQATNRLLPHPATGPLRTAPAKSADTRPETGAGQRSRFAAQLLAAEGGLRVMLRLPRLSDAERSDLETRLGQMLESFGHRRREIIIQEITTA